MLTIIARPEVNPSMLKLVKEAMLELVELTKVKPGCIRYELHQDINQPNKLTFFETWESKELWIQHMQSEDIKAFNDKTGGGLIGFELQQMEQVG